MNDLVEAARIRVQQLRQELAALEEFLDASERARALLSGLTPQAASGESRGPIQNSPVERLQESGERRTRVTDNPKPAAVVDAAIRIMKERGRPMTRRELHGALAEMGLEVKGADPIKALGTMLWRGRDRIEQLEGRGYWPKGEPPPQTQLKDLL